MNISHGWFTSGSYRLARHVDLPSNGTGSVGVVIVPAFGWEDICSYRPLRFLGKALAENGFPVLRFDLPGTGDSSGSALDPGLVEAWLRSVPDAMDELRFSTGVDHIAVAGVGLGALLAAAAAIRGADFSHLVLWGCPQSGRAALRQLRVLAKLETPEFANGELPAPQPGSGLEVAGFLLSRETQRDLESVDLLSPPAMSGKPILILSRDDLAVDPKLVNALKTSGAHVEMNTGSGYAAAMAEPHDALPSDATAQVIAEFLHRHPRLAIRPAVRYRTHQSTVVLEHGGAKVLETAFNFGSSSSSLFGILSEPHPSVPGAGHCLLFLNPGATRHIGANRMWVQSARRWAARGVPSFRMDFSGVGESDGQPSRGVAGLYQDELWEDIQAAMRLVSARLGAQHFVLVGLCSGAFWAFQSALRSPDVRGAILLNPRLFFWDPDVDRRRILRRTVNGLADSNAWRRLAQGKISAQRIRQAGQSLLEKLHFTGSYSERSTQIPAEALRSALATIEENECRLTMVFTEGEPLLLEMEEEGHRPADDNPHIRLVRMANCGHTFRPRWAQQRVHELIDRACEATILENVSMWKGSAANA